jgi:hypothetical protein
MAGENPKDKTFTAGRLAKMLGCSVRSIYRWEKSGVIPPATRIERGGVSTRIYTASQVEEIRHKVQGRLDLTTAARPTPQTIHEILGVTPDLMMMMDQFGDIFEKSGSLLRVPFECQRPFVRAMEFARKHGCKEIAVTAPDGTTRIFSVKASKKRSRG